MNEPLQAGHITLSIGQQTWDSILRTSYGSDGGFGEFMRAALADARRATRGVTPTRELSAMPDMWDDLAVFLERFSYHGTNATKAAQRMARNWAILARKIRAELAKAANHPAYKNVAILGVERTVFSAWMTDESAIWQVPFFPTLRAAMAKGGTTFTHGLLIPTHMVAHQRTLTIWQFRPTNDQTETTPPTEQSSAP